ncbi:uncharacterized protein LOC109414091 isoform X1 [Aedes albopictus]|uniref:Secreted protein n=1 Tax=Aedes albopictus TaxID=7160 RepID=A0ABM2A162_AEDAL|nr:uncharacterized protein LOC109414091 isoform X1 [Aedes albopictus]
MQILRLTACIVFGVCFREIFAEETKTFPGAEIIIPAVIGQVAPAVIGAIISGIGGIAGGGGGGLLPPVPPVPPISVSHTTAVATSIANKPIAVSHSGSLSTNSHTNAGSQATTAGSGSLVAISSTAVTNPLRNLSKRWQKFFKNIR